MAKTNGAVQNVDILGGVALAVAGVTTVWTESFVCPKDVTFGFEYKFASPGVVACDIFVEQGNTAPVPESAISTDMVVPDGASAMAADVGDTLKHVTAYSPVVTNFIRFKIVGKGLNDAGTTLASLVINTIVNA